MSLCDLFIILGFLAVIVLLYFCCAHVDIVITGNASWQIWNSHFTDFYEVVTKWEDSMSANYLPTTYILFGLWVLPLKIFGFPEPVTAGTVSLEYLWWYKLLPTLFYAGCMYLIYRIATGMGMGRKKSLFCALAFGTAPIAVYSQFIFSQYDSFTVFFVLLGVYYAMRDNRVGFIASFAVAVTLKYFALLFFLVFLLLKEKRVLRILIQTALTTVLLLLYYAIFMRSSAFKECVFGFKALDYISHPDFSTLLGDVSFMQVAAAAICAWAYFEKPQSKLDYFKWGVFLCCGECFALFGLSTFHPQWLILAVPFWTMAAYIHRDNEIHLWLDMLLGILYLLFAVMYWYDWVDDHCLYNGILWSKLLNWRAIRVHMADVIPYKNRNQLYTLIVALILVFFVFNHPKYGIETPKSDVASIVSKRWVFYLRAFVLPAAYIALAIICLISTMKLDPVVSLCHSIGSWHSVQEDGSLEQVFIARYPVLDKISFIVKTSPQENSDDLAQEEEKDLCVELVDRTTGKRMSWHVEIPDVDGEQSIELDLNKQKLAVGREYGLRFSCTGIRSLDYLLGGDTSQANMRPECYAIIGNDKTTYNFAIDFYYQE